MRRLFRIISLASLVFAALSLYGFITLLGMKIKYDDIKANGRQEDGIIVAIYNGPWTKNEVEISLSDTVIFKTVSGSEFLYAEGDTIQIYNYSVYPKDYIIYSRIELFQIFTALVLTLLFLVPITTYMITKKRFNSR